MPCRVFEAAITARAGRQSWPTTRQAAAIPPRFGASASKPTYRDAVPERGPERSGRRAATDLGLAVVSSPAGGGVEQRARQVGAPSVASGEMSRRQPPLEEDRDGSYALRRDLFQLRYCSIEPPPRSVPASPPGRQTHHTVFQRSRTLRPSSRRQCLQRTSPASVRTATIIKRNAETYRNPCRRRGCRLDHFESHGVGKASHQRT